MQYAHVYMTNTLFSFTRSLNECPNDKFITSNSFDTIGHNRHCFLLYIFLFKQKWNCSMSILFYSFLMYTSQSGLYIYFYLGLNNCVNRPNSLSQACLKVLDFFRSMFSLVTVYSEQCFARFKGAEAIFRLRIFYTQVNLLLFFCFW